MGRAGPRAGLGLVLLALGCATGGPPPEDHFYRLPGADAAASAPAAGEPPALGGVLEVERLRTDAVTGGRAIVWSRGASSPELERHRYHHWADAPADMIQERMAESLRAAGVARSVVTPVMRVRADYRLGGRLEHFERVLDDAGPAVLVEMRLVLQEREHGGVLWRRRYRVRAPAAGDSVPAAVDAFGAALARLLEGLAADLRATPPGAGAAGPSDDAMLAPRA